jgi:TorA maturation chaperone TorD
MTTSVAKATFLGHAFLGSNAGALSTLAEELNLPEFRRALAEGGGTLEIEYNRLFLNPAGTPCPPWQSAHGEEPRLMGEAHLSALEWFRRFGVEPAATNEPADHIGLLLLFYAQLLQSDAGPEALDQFRVQHLSWIPSFCDSIEREATHPFYVAVARETAAVTTAFPDGASRRGRQDAQ